MPIFWFLAALAPLLVAFGLLVLRDVTFVFVAYHLVLCLGVPAVLARRQGAGWSDHWRRLGLTGPGTRTGLVIGIPLGLAMAAAPPLAQDLLPGLFPDPEQLQAVLRGWGMDPAAPGPVLLFLALINAPAEEMFWRGFLQDRLLTGTGSVLGRGVALAILFASYHVLTVGALAPGLPGMATMLAGVAGAGMFWVWSRHRWRSLWPALLSHSGATLGYLGVCWQLLQ
jgi:membrane protease YdiL (CAAX protease family)